MPLLLFLLSVAGQAQDGSPADRTTEVEIPARAGLVLTSNGNSVWRTLEALPNPQMLRAAYSQCRIYVGRTGATSGLLIYDSRVRHDIPTILDVRADRTVLLSEPRSGLLYFWSPRDEILQGLPDREERLRAPSGRRFDLLRANDYGLFAEDTDTHAYYFLPWKDKQPQLDLAVELLRGPRYLDDLPRFGDRWIVWDGRRLDRAKPYYEHRCEMMAFDCQERKLTELPLKDFFRFEASEEDLILMRRRVTRDNQATNELLGFDLAAGKQTAAYSGPELFPCVKLRDGIGYLVKSTHDPLTKKHLGKLAAVDFRVQATPLFVQYLPPSDRVQPLISAAGGLIHLDAPATVIPWAVRP